MNILYVWIKQNIVSIVLNPMNQKQDIHPLFEEHRNLQSTSVSEIVSLIQEIVLKKKIKSISLILSLDSKKESFLDIDSLNVFSLFKLKHLLKKQARQQGHVVLQQHLLQDQNERKLYTCIGILTFYSQELWNELKKQRQLLPLLDPYLIDSEQKSEEFNDSQKDLISLAPKMTKPFLKRGLIFCCLACFVLSGYYLTQAFLAYRTLIPVLQKNEKTLKSLPDKKFVSFLHPAKKQNSVFRLLHHHKNNSSSINTDALRIWYDRLAFKTEDPFFALQSLLQKVHQYNFLVQAEFKIPDSFYSDNSDNEKRADSESALSFKATVSPALLYHKENTHTFEKKILSLQAKKIHQALTTEQDDSLKGLQKLSIKRKLSDLSLSISLILPFNKPSNFR